MSEVLTFRGYTPKPWQKVVHEAIAAAGPTAGKVFVVKSPRQIGKSIMIEMELLRHAINYKNSVNICLSITFSNCKKIFKELYDGISASKIIRTCDKQAMEITLINGSQIIFKSAQQRESLRGYTIKNNGILCIDESAYIQEDIFSKVFPWTNVNRANILMVSTPGLKTGTFYEFFNDGLTPNDITESFDLSKYDTSEMLSPKMVEFYRKKLPKNQFITEILGEFSESGAGVFDISKDIWVEALPKSYDEIFLGIDWSNGTNNDFTVVSGFNAAGQQVLLEKTRTLSPTNQVNWIVNIIKKLPKQKIKKILCEQNSIGAVYFDMLKGRLPGYPIEDFVTSNSSKREIVEYLIKRVDNETVKLINDKEQYVQFSAYAMEITKTGVITYNALPGCHDDCVMADAFAFKCIKNLESSSYTLSFGHKTNGKQKNLLRNKWN